MTGIVYSTSAVARRTILESVSVAPATMTPVLALQTTQKHRIVPMRDSQLQQVHQLKKVACADAFELASSGRNTRFRTSDGSRYSPGLALGGARSSPHALAEQKAWRARRSARSMVWLWWNRGSARCRVIIPWRLTRNIMSYYLGSLAAAIDAAATLSAQSP